MIENRTHIESGITLSRDPLVGEVIDRYRLVEAVGDGAMANVYRAQHTTLTDRRYAIVVLRPNIASKPQVAERFRREARILSQLEHPNIISVIDAGTTSHGLLYMVLDYAEGPTLKDLMRSDKKMSIERTVDVISQILSALKRIHSLGYIHRDIKPDNIVITKSEGRDLVKILDFGIAGMAQADPDLTRLTEVNRICGTPHYMAPEQASASEILAPVDIYAVGAILYEILEGRPPFVGPLTEVLVQKLVADPKPPANSGNLAAMTMSMLERDPEARPTAARLLPSFENGSRPGYERINHRNHRCHSKERIQKHHKVATCVGQIWSPLESRVFALMLVSRWFVRIKHPQKSTVSPDDVADGCRDCHSAHCR